VDKHTAEQQLLNLDRVKYMADMQKRIHQSGVEQAQHRADTAEHTRQEILAALAGMDNTCDCPA
jgi:hypothetical protein